MKSTTIRIRESSRGILRELAAREGLPMQAILDDEMWTEAGEIVQKDGKENTPLRSRSIDRKRTPGTAIC